jgi:hypothetical protein
MPFLISQEEKRSYCAPLPWEVTFDDLEPADLGGRIWFIGFISCAIGREPFLDAIYNGTSKVGCS